MHGELLLHKGWSNPHGGRLTRREADSGDSGAILAMPAPV